MGELRTEITQILTILTINIKPHSKWGHELDIYILHYVQYDCNSEITTVNYKL